MIKERLGKASASEVSGFNKIDTLNSSAFNLERTQQDGMCSNLDWSIVED